jgi:dihydropyrimidine dehydrogenase (NAD+) subunit PreA
MRGFAAGWAGAVTKTITLKGTISPRPRLGTSPRNSRNLFLENIELLSDYGIDTWCKWIEEITINFEQPVIASIMAPADNPGEWAELAKLTVQSGAKAVELNVSCPHGMPERAAGAFIGQDVGLTGEITSAVREAVNAPIWVKLTPNVTDIVAIAEAAVKAGADALAAINTLSGISGVDLDSMLPIPSVAGYSTYGGISGPAVKPVALKCVSSLAAYGHKISGMGGVSQWEDAAEFILLGAGTVQVCTMVMYQGFDVIHNLTSGLEKYIQSKEFNSVNEIIGIAQRKIIEYEKLDFRNQVKYTIGPECDKCGDCITACDDGGFQAITMGRKRAAINQKKCDKCGLCEIVCPVMAIKMSKI